MNEEEKAAWEIYKQESHDRYVKSAKWFAGFTERGTFLTVKDMRLALEGVPDDAPVLYQRIEDKFFDTPNNGWETVSLIWERDHQYSEYIPAFSSHKHKTADGRDVFVVNAHY